MRKAVDGDHPQRTATDAWQPAAGEVLIGEKSVEVGRNRRSTNGMIEAGQTEVEMGEEAIVHQALDFELGAQPPLELGGLGLEGAVDGAPLLPAGRQAGDKQLSDAGVDLPRRDVGRGEDARGDEVSA